MAKIDNCLDDLGQKLLAIFEESWEVSQSINELKGLREQNETILKGKIKELENAVGDVPLYNKVTEEISALKEVMANNDNILKEMEANLQASSQEKNVVQGQILEIISQSARGAQITQSDENFQHINKGFQLLERESQILDLNFSSRKEVPALVKENIKKDDKIRNLEEELQLMKKQLNEKVKFFPLLFYSFF